jgi:hypothetical protein
MEHEDERERGSTPEVDGGRLGGSGQVAGEGAGLEGLVRLGIGGRLAGATTPSEERRLLLALQRSAGNVAVNRLLRAVAPPAVEPPARAADGGARALLVADDEPEPEPGQMRRGEFLDKLKASVSATAEEELGAMTFRVMGCPWIEHWIEHYRGRQPREIEQAIRRYAPAAAGAQSVDALAAASARGSPRGSPCGGARASFPRGSRAPKVGRGSPAQRRRQGRATRLACSGNSARDVRSIPPWLGE